MKGKHPLNLLTSKTRKIEMQDRIRHALQVAEQFGNTDGAHHKMWVIDQMVRVLTGCVTRVFIECEADQLTDEYREWVRRVKDGEDGPETYNWDTGIAP